MKKIYISGKIDNANYKADFEAAELALKIAGFQPVNPAQQTRCRTLPAKVAAFRRRKKAAQQQFFLYFLLYFVLTQNKKECIL